jgi:hypothetical protein
MIYLTLVLRIYRYYRLDHEQNKIIIDNHIFI